jgi:hypothetical protein
MSGLPEIWSIGLMSARPECRIQVPDEPANETYRRQIDCAPAAAWIAMSWYYSDDAVFYTHLLATISECGDSFKVMLELSDCDGDVACAEETASSMELASALVAAVAKNFSIERVNVRIEVDRGGATLH